MQNGCQILFADGGGLCPSVCYWGEGGGIHPRGVLGCVPDFATNNCYKWFIRESFHIPTL